MSEQRVSTTTLETGQHVPAGLSANALGELLSEFSGADDTFWKWERQFRLIRETYRVSENTARILVGMKLRRRALEWFHSRPEHIEMPVEELLDEMRGLFDHRPAKIERRKQCEKRKWKPEESFMIK